MIVLKILAAPFVVALTLLVAIVSFLYCVASALCQPLSCSSAARRWAAWCSLCWRSSFRPLASRPSLTGSWTGSTR